MKPNLSPVSFWKSLLPVGRLRGSTFAKNIEIKMTTTTNKLSSFINFHLILVDLCFALIFNFFASVQGFFVGPPVTAVPPNILTLQQHKTKHESR